MMVSQSGQVRNWMITKKPPRWFICVNFFRADPRRKFIVFDPTGICVGYAPTIPDGWKLILAILARAAH